MIQKQIDYLYAYNKIHLNNITTKNIQKLFKKRKIISNNFKNISNDEIDTKNDNNNKNSKKNINITSKRRLIIVVNHIIQKISNNVLNHLQFKISISINISNIFISIVKKQSSLNRNKSNEFIFLSKTNNRKYRRDINRHFFR